VDRHRLHKTVTIHDHDFASYPQVEGGCGERIESGSG
jgi:hypothetical protein